MFGTGQFQNKKAEIVPTTPLYSFHKMYREVGLYACRWCVTLSPQRYPLGRRLIDPRAVLGVAMKKTIWKASYWGLITGSFFCVSTNHFSDTTKMNYYRSVTHCKSYFCEVRGEKVKLCLCLTKYQAMKVYPILN